MQIQNSKPDGDIVIMGATQEARPTGDGTNWKVGVSAAGMFLLHLFPLDSLEWRAAEYEIDPDDRETLLDVVLAEPWFSDGIDLLEHPSGLYNAPTIDEARNFHLGRVTVVKSDHGLYSAPRKDRVLLRDTATDPREYIKSASHIDHRVVGAKREIVGIERDKVRTRREKQAEMRRVEKSAGMRLLSVPQEIVTPDTNADLRLARLGQTLKGMRSYGNRNN